MKFSDYQRSIRETDQRPGKELEDMTVHLLGLAGEAGSVAAAYKKYIRDGAADVAFKLRMREEIGDALWYLATIADHLGLNLDEVAMTNLDKTRGRWLLGDADPYDSTFPDRERLPRQGTYEFIPGVNSEGRKTITVMFDGGVLGASESQTPTSTRARTVAVPSSSKKALRRSRSPMPPATSSSTA